MVERYTDKARRTIGFAGEEARQLGSSYIGPEHLLLGLLRELKWLATILPYDTFMEERGEEVSARARVGEKTTRSHDPLPLSDESERLLIYAAEEADRLGHRHVGTEHLLLGLLRENRGTATQSLNRRGVSLDAVREPTQRRKTEMKTDRALPPGPR